VPGKASGQWHAPRSTVLGSDQAPQFRYIAVLVLTLAAVLFAITMPTTDWSRALVIASEGLALVITVATSRERSSLRRRRAATVAVTMIVGVILVALGVPPGWLTAAFAVVVTAAVPVALVRGLLRLMVERGVTVEAVAGAVAVYLTLGLIFAFVVGFVAQIGSSTYFAQHTNGSQGDKVYFSFTVLTTTGFGDFAPATPVGHGIAVIEMLTGQLYLVTVIGLLVGNFAARRRRQ
jgi:hypothetical protein